LDGSFYGEDLLTSGRIWFENGIKVSRVERAPRIGIDYAGEYWKEVPWRFYLSHRPEG
jgi:DNA-3-methyladenine glycosylase